MSGEILTRTTYRDPTTNVVRSGNPTDGEAATDMEQYYQPLERVHGSGLHSFGVAGGQGVTATFGQTGFKVLPGVALDAHGRHISLAVGGSAEVGSNAGAPGVAPDLVSVAADGAPFDTKNLAGEFDVTIQWWETFDWSALQNYSVYRFNHTPWIRLQAVNSFVADGTNGIILAHIRLDTGNNTGNVIALTEDRRFTAGLPVGAIRVRRGFTKSPAPNAAIDDTVSAGLDPRPSGGLDISVPGASDEIHLKAADGNFANLDVSANSITARHPNGTPSVQFETGSATAQLGMQGQAGHLDVRGPNDQFSVFLNGDSGHIITGGPGLTGAVRVKNSNAADTVILEAGAGDVWFAGRLQDPTGAHPGVGHDQLRELTDGALTWLHRHHTADASTPAVNWMYCTSFSSTIVSISVPTRMQVLASIVITSILPINGAVDYDDALLAEIYRVDGNDYRQGGWRYGSSQTGPDGDDANLRSPVYEGPARTITFRLRSRDDCEIGALAVVYSQP